MTRKGSISIRFELTQAEKDRITQEAQKLGLKEAHFVKMLVFRYINSEK